MLTAPNLKADDMAVRLGSYAPLLTDRFPPDAFTRASLEAVAAQCTFWPAYGELCKHLGEWWADHKPFVYHPPADYTRPALAAPEPEPRLTAEQAAEGFARVRAAFAEAAIEADAAKPKAAPKSMHLSRETLNAAYASQGLKGPPLCDREAQPYRVEGGA